MVLATARLSFFLAYLLMSNHTVLLAHGTQLRLLSARRGGQRGGRRGGKHTAAQLWKEVPSMVHTGAVHSGAAAQLEPDVHCTEHSTSASASEAAVQRLAAQMALDIQGTELSASRSAPLDIGAEEFLASCGFSTTDLPGEPVKWYTAADACNVLGKFDLLMLVGDSLTRQVRCFGGRDRFFGPCTAPVWKLTSVHSTLRPSSPWKVSVTTPCSLLSA